MELTAQQWAEWRNHPVTLVFRNYLRDFQKSLKDEGWERLQMGVLSQVEMGEFKGRSAALLEMADLPHEALVNFYAAPQEEDNGSQSNQD